MVAAEQVVLKIQTCTVKQDAPGSEALLDAKELQVQLTCGDFNMETPWKTSGSSFLFEKELALPDNELEFMIFGRGGAQNSIEAPVARALEERGGKLTECDKDTSDKMDLHGRRKHMKHIELKLVPLGDATAPVLGTLVIFLNAPKGSQRSQPPPTVSATAQPATGASGAGGGGPLLHAVPEVGAPTAGGAGGAGSGAGGARMEGWEAAAQAADEAADEARHEQSLPELSNVFAELHKLRSDLKKEQRVLEHRAHECAEAEEALDNAREQVLENTTCFLLLATNHLSLTHTYYLTTYYSPHHSPLTTHRSHHLLLTTPYLLLLTCYPLFTRCLRRPSC